MKLQTYAQDLLNFGFELAPIFSVTENGECGCGNPNCYKIGKHLFNLSNKAFGTRSLPKLQEMVRFHRNANLAVMTGIRSNLVIVDVDRPAIQAGSYERLCEAFPELHSTMCVKTGSGGFHYYFRSQEIFHSNTNQFGLGIDLLAENSCAISVGSTHKTGTCYEFHNLVTPLAFPNQLATLARNKEAKMKPIIR